MLDNKDLTFSLDEFDNAVAEECVSIMEDKSHEDDVHSASLIIMTGMMFCAHVRKRMIKNKKED